MELKSLLVWRREGETFDVPNSTTYSTSAVEEAAADGGEIQSSRNVITLQELDQEFKDVSTSTLLVKPEPSTT